MRITAKIIALLSFFFALLIAPAQFELSPMTKMRHRSRRQARNAASPDYTIRPGDVLQISVWKEEQLDQEVLVLADGTINYPLIGSVSAEG